LSNIPAYILIQITGIWMVCVCVCVCGSDSRCNEALGIMMNCVQWWNFVWNMLINYSPCLRSIKHTLGHLRPVSACGTYKWFIRLC